jgi:hypothetical protein
LLSGGNESLRQSCKVIFLAALPAKSFREKPVRHESETPAAVITALHANPPLALCCCRGPQWSDFIFPRGDTGVSSEGKAR